MFMKYLEFGSRRWSYCVGKVLVQYIRSSEGYRNILNARSNFLPLYISKKTGSSKLSHSKAIAESYDYVIKEQMNLTRKSLKRRKVADDIYESIKDSCPSEVLDTLPKKYFSRKQSLNEQLCLVNPNIADIIVQRIKKSILKDDVVVLEINPGAGILSKKLIDVGVKQLHLHESSSGFRKVLLEFQYLHSDRVTLHFSDFLSLWKLAYQDKMDHGSRLKDVLSPYPTRSWTEDPPLVIFGGAFSSNFIKYSIRCIVFQTGLMAHCRPEMYFLVSPTAHLRLTCSGKDGYLRYRTISVLFQLFFDYELVEKVPRKFFLPWGTAPNSKKRKISEIALLDMEWLYLMKIVPKRDLYQIIHPDKLPALWFFVRHHFWNRSKKVIPELESWIPGCGIRLILEGYNIHTEFGDLKPSEVLYIFQQFSSWPEYLDSCFLPLVDSALMKLDENPDENLTKPERNVVADDNVDNEDGNVDNEDDKVT